MCEVLDNVENRGIKIGEARGEERGVKIGTLATYIGLVADGLLDVKIACERCNMAEEDFMNAYSEYVSKK